ncbi:YdiU family protein [Belliella sp. R4-6]|uniref:Protein nucleotidyltransferase YdiU n=1 Tax=Belliella alkalica TaxID=1730871 RepID=A0ABS9VBK0_9BACT|nr:YdiU family protein [Belliella alkalica]MCH7413823.1 YdiU family protein [Belliella alkalica]
MNMKWNLQHSYSSLPNKLFSFQSPIPVKSPKLVLFNHELAQSIDLEVSDNELDKLSQVLGGNVLPENSKPLAQAYAGHQFGNFTILGDGRAILIGEQLTNSQKLFDIQLKGSGRTPYSRGGDGRATLKSMLREYLISEAMYHLGISSSRSLAVVASGETVQREWENDGAILTRVAKSHIRVGTFEFAYQYLSLEEQKELTVYVIKRHYPELEGSKNPALELLKKVMEKQAELISDWMRVGFIHGVMNTDNVSIAGETIDYGPCAFMNVYDPGTVFSSIDTAGRYAFGNQPKITHWNLSRLAIALLPQIDEDQDKAVKTAQETLNQFPDIYESKYLQLMRNKLGLIGEEPQDKALVEDLLNIMNQMKADYTNTFASLTSGEFSENELFENDRFQDWYLNWIQRATKNGQTLEAAQKTMALHNPIYIPRNHKVEEALFQATENNDYSIFHEMLKVMKTPYQFNENFTAYQFPALEGDNGYQTFCGT